MEQVDLLFNDIFSRSLRSMGNFYISDLLNPGQDKPLLSGAPIEKGQIEYIYNSHGYRCDEFDNQDILILGCSYTSGVALPVEKTWPYFLSKKMNMSYANLAKGGDSGQAQVIKAFQFFKEFHHPKYIFAVVPLTRIEMPYVKNKFGKKDNSSDSYEKKENLKIIQQCFLSENNFENISKKPHDPHSVLPVEVAVFYNLMFLQMLEQYCDSNNIIFFWTTHEFIKNDQQRELLKKQITSKHFFIDEAFSTIDLTCHQEYSSHKFFEWGADNDKERKILGHWGWHKHMHLADTIYNLLQN